MTYTRRHDQAESSYYRRVGAEPPGQLSLLVKYGRIYLSEDEYRRRLAARVFDYAALLGRKAGRFRDAEFRDYHAAILSEVRGSIGTGEVLDGIVLAIGRRLQR